jgi:hypothetical protein
MTADTSIRRLTAAAVMLVAAIAAVVSFIHIQHLAASHGQTELAAYLLPVSVDGTVAAASLSMLWAARTGLPTAWISRCMLTLGVGATLAANVAYGAPFGLSGELLSGWPAVAFVGSVEMVLVMVRRARTVPETVTDTNTTVANMNAAVPMLTQTAPADSAHAAQLALAASVAAGNPISQRQMIARFGLSRAAEHRVRQAVLAGSNGHG